MKRRLIAWIPAVALVALVGLLAGVGARRAVGAAEPQAPEAFVVTLVLEPMRDNTLYESAQGLVSNGRGQHLFAGKTDNGFRRRAVLAFDLSAVPPLSEVQTANLSLNMSKTTAGATPVTLHTLTRAWGEGASDAPGEEGAGGLAQDGDATWLYTFFDDTRWNQPGGDFDAAPSATAVVAGLGRYGWSSPAVVGDVQGWLDAPATNHGWVLLGNEATDGSAKRFDSRESVAANRPRLILTIRSEAVQAFLPGVLGSDE